MRSHSCDEQRLDNLFHNSIIVRDKWIIDHQTISKINKEKTLQAIFNIPLLHFPGTKTSDAAVRIVKFKTQANKPLLRI